MFETIKKFLVDLWKRNKDKLWEAVKAALRYTIFAVLSLIVTDLLLQPNLSPILFAVLTGVDKWIHENWKENKKVGLKGLAPF